MGNLLVAITLTPGSYRMEADKSLLTGILPARNEASKRFHLFEYSIDAPFKHFVIVPSAREAGLQQGRPDEDRTDACFAIGRVERAQEATGFCIPQARSAA